MWEYIARNISFSRYLPRSTLQIRQETKSQLIASRERSITQIWKAFERLWQHPSLFRQRLNNFRRSTASCSWRMLPGWAQFCTLRMYGPTYIFALSFCVDGGIRAAYSFRIRTQHSYSGSYSLPGSLFSSRPRWTHIAGAIVPTIRLD